MGNLYEWVQINNNTSQVQPQAQGSSSSNKTVIDYSKEFQKLSNHIHDVQDWAQTSVLEKDRFAIQFSVCDIIGVRYCRESLYTLRIYATETNTNGIEWIYKLDQIKPDHKNIRNTSAKSYDEVLDDLLSYGVIEDKKLCESKEVDNMQLIEELREYESLWESKLDMPQHDYTWTLPDGVKIDLGEPGSINKEMQRYEDLVREKLTDKLKDDSEFLQEIEKRNLDFETGVEKYLHHNAIVVGIALQNIINSLRFAVDDTFDDKRENAEKANKKIIDKLARDTNIADFVDLDDILKQLNNAYVQKNLDKWQAKQKESEEKLNQLYNI